VFGDARDLSPEAVRTLWDDIKRAEKAERRRDRGAGESASVLDGVPQALPALSRADKLTRKAATVGFDWPDPAQVSAKVREELDEVAEAAAHGVRPALEDEIGDLLFAAANLARHYGIDPEDALRHANAKFERRFRAVETALARQGRPASGSTLDEMERLWSEAKRAERGAESA
jgi:ATP diphosphatase